MTIDPQIGEQNRTGAGKEKTIVGGRIKGGGQQSPESVSLLCFPPSFLLFFSSLQRKFPQRMPAFSVADDC